MVKLSGRQHPVKSLSSTSIQRWRKKKKQVTSSTADAHQNSNDLVVVGTHLPRWKTSTSSEPTADTKDGNDELCVTGTNISALDGKDKQATLDGSAWTCSSTSLTSSTESTLFTQQHLLHTTKSPSTQDLTSWDFDILNRDHEHLKSSIEAMLRYWNLFDKCRIEKRSLHHFISCVEALYQDQP